MRRLFGRSAFTTISRLPAQKEIIIVSGLPRSGTSLMMQILQAGGVELVQDGVRSADHDNPNGYFEVERVKKLPFGDHHWLVETEGKAVKIIATLLTHLPLHHRYKLIFLWRDLEEVIASQRKMLLNRGEEVAIQDDEAVRLSRQHLQQVEAWLRQQQIPRLTLGYRELIGTPQPALERLEQFLGRPLNSAEMMRVINPALYRNRK